MRMSFLRRSNCAGFSLMEVAIGMTVLGLLMSGFLAGYRIYQKTKAENVTAENIVMIEEAIGTFLTAEGRYPRPTPFAMADGQEGYGREVDLSDITDCGSTAPVSAVVCRATAGVRNVLIGSIPFIDLNLPQEAMVDGWGNKFTYAVSETLSDANIANDVNEICVNIQSVAADGAYQRSFACMAEDTHIDFSNTLPPVFIPYEDIVIISHGRDGVGSWTAEGKLKLVCNTPVPNGNGSAGVQIENCNYNGTFVRPRAVVNIFAELHETTNTALIQNIERPTRFIGTRDALAEEYNDDIVSIDIKLDSNYWAEDVDDPIVKNNVGSRIGIGIEDPLARVDVDGGIASTATDVVDLCTYDTSLTGLNKHCFKSTSIASVAGTQCGKGSYLIGIANSKPICEPPAPSFDCATDSIVIGFDADGRPICQNPDNPTACITASQTRNVSCPPGQGGNIVEKRTYNCPGGWTGWVVDPTDPATIPCKAVTPDCPVQPPEALYGTCVSDGLGEWLCCQPNEPCEKMPCQATYP